MASAAATAAAAAAQARILGVAMLQQKVVQWDWRLVLLLDTHTATLLRSIRRVTTATAAVLLLLLLLLLLSAPVACGVQWLTTWSALQVGVPHIAVCKAEQR
jgi:hypothetical protein